MAGEKDWTKIFEISIEMLAQFELIVYSLIKREILDAEILTMKHALSTLFHLILRNYITFYLTSPDLSACQTKKHESTLVHDPLAKAEIFNHMFNSTFTKSNFDLPPVTGGGSKLL